MKPATTLIQNLQSRRRSDGHNVVGIQGPPGYGKSTIGLIIALRLDPGFSTKQVYYSRENWQQILTAPKGGIFLLDEGANVAMNRTWQDKSQVKLMQILNMIRQRNHTLIWATPNLQRLDVVVREDLLTHRVNVFKKGVAKIQTPRFDFHGLPDGWRTWAGYVRWGPITHHPIWKPYYDAKEANYSAITKATIKATGRPREALEAIRPKYRNAKGQLTNDPRQAVAQVQVEADEHPSRPLDKV